MILKKLFLVAATLGVFGSGSLYAQNRGWYMGIGAGQSRAKDAANCSDLNGVLNPGYSCSSHDTDTGAKVFGGYQFNQYIAGEVSYVSLGTFKLSASGTAGGVFVPATANASDKPSGFSIDAIGSYPITREFAVLGRVGVFVWSLDASASVSTTLPGASGSTSDKPTGTSIDYGIGVKYDFTKIVGVRAEWQTFKSIGNSNTGKSDVDLLSASLVYRFQ